jgi:hypothetical protein
MKPRVWKWFLLYVASLVFTYFLCVVLGIGLLVWGTTLHGPDAAEMMFTGALVAGISMPFLVGVGAAPFLPRRKWVWVYDLILIAFGMGSCLWMPFSIYLLVKWIEPDVKNYFGA